MNHKFLNLVQTQLSNGFNKSSIPLNMKYFLVYILINGLIYVKTLMI